MSNKRIYALVWLLMSCYSIGYAMQEVGNEHVKKVSYYTSCVTRCMRMLNCNQQCEQKCALEAIYREATRRIQLADVSIDDPGNDEHEVVESEK